MKNKLKAAVISAGMIANIGHLPAYQSFQGLVSVEAICDPDPVKAASTAQRFNIPHVFSDAKEMLAVIRPEMVSICSPNASHKELTKMALEAGVNVICEKPLAFNYADAKELFSLADQNNLLLSACQTGRFNRAFFAAKEYIDDGRLGTIYFAEINRIRRRGIPGWGAFHKKEASGGGAMADIGVHALDSLLWMMGSPKVTAVSGCSSAHIVKNERNVIYNPEECGAIPGINPIMKLNHDEFNVEEFSSGSIRTEKDIHIIFKIAWAANLPNSNSFSIAGDKMGIKLPELHLYSTLGKNQLDSVPRLFGYGEFDDRRFAGHHYLIQNFIRALLGREELIVKPEETLNVTAAIDLFYQSCEIDREVNFTELLTRNSVNNE